MLCASQAFATMEEELGRPLASVFSSISEGPIAAASLGQVYKGVLRESGEAVAIKVGPLAALCSGSRAQSSEFRIQGSGFRVQYLGFRVHLRLVEGCW